MKRLTAIVLAGMVLVSILGGCADKKSTSEAQVELILSAPGEFPISEETYTFNVMVPQTTYIKDFNTNGFIKWYEEKTNVVIDFEQVAEAAIKEKVNLTLASGKLPDAFLGCGISTSDLVKYGDQGVFIPLNDMITEQGFYFNQVLEENEILAGAITAPDGSIFGLPRINECFHCFYSGKAWINMEWLENVGMEYPTTTDELYEVLTAFDEQDANGNGDPSDEIPMMGSNTGWNTRPYEYLLNAFVYNDYGSRIAVIDDEVTFVANTPEFKDGLLYIKTLIEDGLLDPVSLTQTSEQFGVIGGNPESIDVGVVVAATWWSGLGGELNDPLQRSRQYEGLSPLMGPDGVQETLTQEGGISPAHFVITSLCENPEVLFRWAEGMYDSYIGLSAGMGLEGIGWEKAEEGVLGLGGEQALYNVLIYDTTEGSSNDKGIPNFATSNHSAEVREGQAVLGEEELKWGVEPRLFQETLNKFAPYRSDKAYPAIIFTAEESELKSNIEVPLQDYILENIVAFVSGTRDIDTEWDAYIGEFDALRVPELLEILQAGYDRLDK